MFLALFSTQLVLTVLGNQLLYTHFDSVNDQNNFKIDLEGGSYVIEASWYKAYANVTDPNMRGRSEFRRDNMLSGNRIKRYFKATYFIPNNPGNQAGIIGQAMEQISGAPWKPIFFWMAWPGKGVELSVYTDLSANPILKKISTEDPRGRMHTIEMWGYFTTDNNGWMDVRYDNGPVNTIYTGRTLPTGQYNGCFKVGTYAGYSGGYKSEVWTHMVEVMAANTPFNPISGHSF